MITCPMCKKRLREMVKECPNCKTDVSLLVGYVENLNVGLQRADELCKQGQLGAAVLAYLEVLEVDPDNKVARKQVGQVATAVRMFDQAAQSRRWLKQLQRQTRWQRWASRWDTDEGRFAWLGAAVWFVLVLGALCVGYFLGFYQAATPPPAGTNNPPASTEGKPKLDKDKQQGAGGGT